MAHNTHRTRLTRALANFTGWPYQRAHRHVQHAAHLGLLPARYADVTYPELAAALALIPEHNHTTPDLAAQHCWILTREGEPCDDGFGVQHFTTETEAEAAARRAPGRACTPQQTHTRCLVVSCNTCGYQFDEDEGIEHFPLTPETLQALPRDLLGATWSISCNGALCPACTCEERNEHQFAAGLEDCQICSTTAPTRAYDSLLLTDAQGNEFPASTLPNPLVVIGDVGWGAGVLDRRPGVGRLPGIPLSLAANVTLVLFPNRVRDQEVARRTSALLHAAGATQSPYGGGITIPPGTLPAYTEGIAAWAADILGMPAIGQGGIRTSDIATATGTTPADVEEQLTREGPKWGVVRCGARWSYPFTPSPSGKCLDEHAHFNF